MGLVLGTATGSGWTTGSGMEGPPAPSKKPKETKELTNSPEVFWQDPHDYEQQEAMDINKRSSSGMRSSEGSGKRMREVACPICTVHLQVQVPTSGSETIECGVCQHPFLVSAR